MYNVMIRKQTNFKFKFKFKLQQNCFELYNPYMYAYVYLRRLYPKEIEKFENFQTFFGQPKSKASGCFWGRYRLQKEIVSFVHLKGKNVFKIVSFSSMLKIKKICIPSAKNKKICIPNAKNKRNLHSQCQKF